MTVKKDTFRFGPFLVTRHADGTETWDDESGHPPVRFLPEEEELPQVNLDRIKLTDDCVKIEEDKTAEPTLETQRDEVAHRPVSHSWERQVDMNGDVYIRENEDYLDRD